jgi:hypothetical protein
VSGRERRLGGLAKRLQRLTPQQDGTLPDLTGCTIVDAMQDPELFGEQFAGESWAAWRAFLAALFGLPLIDSQLATYQTHTGRKAAPAHPVREAWLIVGRRGGKSRIAALVAVFFACFRRYVGILAPGEIGVVMVLAADRKQARVVFRYVSGLLRSVPALAALVEIERRESIDLKNGISIEVHSASYRAVRGYTTVAVIADEVAFWQSDESGANPDREVIDALRPGLATVPGALLLGISTPYARRGEVWKAFERYHGRDDAPALVWVADTQSMNPAVDEAVIAAAYQDDPVAAAAEYGGSFRRDVEAFLAPEALEAVTMLGRLELPPASGTPYVAFVDPSGGSQDSMTLAIAHGEERDGQTVAVLDVVRERRPPFSPDDVVRGFAETLKAYNVSTVRGDRYAGEWPRERFQQHGITYEVSEESKSDLYRELLPLVNSARLALLDHRVLRAQFEALERRVARGGKDSIDHPPGGRDDIANAAAGALVAACKVSVGSPFAWLGGRVVRLDGTEAPDWTLPGVWP